MNLLLDTHTFLWWVTGDRRLSARALSLMEDRRNRLWFSAASGWEMAIKASLGRLTVPGELAALIFRQLDASAIGSLPVNLEHALRTATVPLHHADPFDRLLVAQAQVEGLTILSADPNIARYDVTVVW